MHRAYRQEIHKKFDDWAYSVKNTKPAEQRDHSQSLAYRVAFIRQAELAISEEQAYFAAYKDYGDICSGLGLPLLVNDRVVGVLTLTGKNKGQFNKRLFPALQRAAHLIGQVMYQATQMWQMRQLSWLTTHIPYWQWQQHDLENQFNPLQHVSQCLCNIFLCRAAHIWLQDDSDSALYKLHGYNVQDVFPNLTVAPLFEYQKNRQRSKEYVPLERAFACFVLDTVDSSSLGNFQVAIYYPGQEDKTRYTLQAAKAGIRLFQNFVNTQEINNLPYPIYRKKLFEDAYLNHMMTCVLLRDLHTQEKRYEPIGVLILYDSYVSEKLDEESGDFLSPSEWPWSRAWAPMVAHVQTWLPNLLMQIEVRHSPVDKLRRFLIHSVRGELIAIRNEMIQLHTGTAAFSPDGIFRKDLRKLESLGNKLVRSAEMKYSEQHDIGYAVSRLAGFLDNKIKNIRFDVSSVTSEKRLQNIERIILEIERTRDLTWAGVEIEAGAVKFSLTDNLQQIIRSHNHNFKQNDIIPPNLSYWNGFTHDVQLFLEKIWWDQLITTLIENASKYAQHHFDVNWDNETHCLIFVNIGSYNPNLDIKDRLLQMGIRGSASMSSEKTGMGMGLWGAKLICELLRIQFNFEIESDPMQKTLAAYRVKLTLPKQVIV